MSKETKKQKKEKNTVENKKKYPEKVLSFLSCAGKKVSPKIKKHSKKLWKKVQKAHRKLVKFISQHEDQSFAILGVVTISVVFFILINSGQERVTKKKPISQNQRMHLAPPEVKNNFYFQGAPELEEEKETNEAFSLNKNSQAFVLDQKIKIYDFEKKSSYFLDLDKEIREIALSSDRKYLAFIPVSREESDIFLLETKNQTYRRLTFDGSQKKNLVFSPDGRGIYFLSDLDRKEGEIYLTQFDGQKQTRITNNLISEDEFDVSPQDEIVFSASREGNHELFLLHHNQITNLTNSKFNERNPRFSHDGREIIYSKEIQENQREIFVMEKDGLNQIQLSYNNLNEENLDFYDDNQIIFWSEENLFSFSLLDGREVELEL